MSLITLSFTFSVGAVIIASQHNSNFQVIYNDYNGNIQNVNIAANAGIGYSKLSLSSSIQLTDFVNSLKLFLMPSGGIIMWSGTIATIPSGWVLCDGSNSTPDLRNRFIVAADADSGGIAKSTITGSALQTSDTGVMPAHTHTVATSNTSGGASTNVRVGVAAAVDTPQTTSSTGTGTKVISVFYALAYIQKT